MSARAVSALVLGGFLIAGLAACDSGTTTSQPPVGPPTATTAPPATTTTPPVAVTHAAGCPVSADTLLKVVTDKYGRIPGLELRDVQCYQDYAIAGRFAARSDSEVATFHYVSGSWRYFTGGSGGYCEGVPENVKKHFRTMGYGGCD
ncbi:hypothetical protein [Actinoplanes regularis]|uniref:Lipoprotein n=1 Tax=Actinoplanes regularis TaxID=52697 RepID=A0A238W0B4_9ACTN|nr:hypothetical protein [Actinoplanes regularis]GIE91976.1 hypothetical protein Are01nite_84560 [Actinoplanes regularis]SNR39928.1 hypothetical protein SAMN06264365_10242 [Actinoplanes regularis]